jgi:uncharacterized membrane protein YdjX (TVP38/TMEM64 family)
MESTSFQRHAPAQSGFLRKHGQKLVAGAFWLALLGAYFAYTWSNELSPLETLSQLITFMSQSAYGPLVFLAVYILRPLVLFSAALLSIAGGFLFGPIRGVIYTIIGANLGATVAYFIGYFFGQGALESQDQEDKGRLQRYTERMRKNSFETVLIMRFLFLPYDLVNYLAGFLRVSYGAFILATILGSLPGTLSFVLFGASADGDFSDGLPSLNPTVLIASLVIFVVSLALSRLLKRREQE